MSFGKTNMRFGLKGLKNNVKATKDYRDTDIDEFFSRIAFVMNSMQYIRLLTCLGSSDLMYRY